MLAYKSALVATTALVILSTPLIVRAQTAPAPTATNSGGIGEVVVQANRRSERLLNVQESVTAVSATALQNAGVAKTSDLAMVTPGLVMATAGTIDLPVIRGVGSNTTIPGAESNVATYLDNGYQTSETGALFNLPDVESIQVLKGPQGTLFGRNATGGAILITTKAPNLTRPQGDFSVSYGNYNTLEVKGFFTAPIIQDKLAFSVTGMWDRSDGWKTDVATGCKTCAGYTDVLLRGKIRFVPWTGADFTLIGSYVNSSDRNTTATNNWKGDNTANFFPGAVPAYRPWTYSQNPLVYRRNQASINFHGDIDLGPGKLSLTTYYNHNESDIDVNVSFTNVFLAPDALILATPEAFSQEILYTTNQIGRFHAVAGFFYYNSHIPNQTYLGGGTIPSSFGAIASLDRTHSYAVFGDVTADVTDQFSVTLGLRYTDETKFANAYLCGLGPPFGACTSPPSIPPQSTWGASSFFGLHHHTWNSWTPKVTALYKITPRTSLYFNFSNGFTSGGYNETSLQAAPANPETITAYEGGIKSDEFANVSFSAAAFYYDYSNLQTYVTTFNGCPLACTPVAHLANAAKAQIYGVELNAQWRATPNLDFTAGATIMSAKYTKYDGAQVLTPIPCPALPGLGGLFCGNTVTSQSIGGTNMIRSPNWSGDVAANYHRDFSVGRLDASATVYFSGKVYWDYDNHVPQNPYALVNGTIGFRPAGTSLHLSLWAKNLTNAAVLTTTSGSGNYYNVDYNPPRTFGVLAEYTF